MRSFDIIMAATCILIRRSAWPAYLPRGRGIISESAHRGIRSDSCSSSSTGSHRIIRQFRNLRWTVSMVLRRRRPCGCSRKYSDCRRAGLRIILHGMRFQTSMWVSAGYRNRVDEKAFKKEDRGGRGIFCPGFCPVKVRRSPSNDFHQTTFRHLSPC